MDELTRVQLYKDYNSVYNSIVEVCFNSCVDILNNRTLEPHEIKCTDICTQKLVNLNHRFMATYFKYDQIRKKREHDEANKEAINLSGDNTLLESVKVE